MMELTKKHRLALLGELETAQNDLHLQITTRNNSKEEAIIAYSEIGDYLAKARVDLIKKALTDNEIDY